MTHITLGQPPDALSVAEGAAVPLRGGGRGILNRHDGFITLRFKCGGYFAVAAVITHDGSLVGPWTTAEYIDLPALRRELAPKPTVVGGWTTELPRVGDKAHGARWLCAADCGPHGSALYWTHRHGNTPEKQAEFDEALEAWMAPIRGRYEAPGLSVFDQATLALYEAARALGYGARS